MLPKECAHNGHTDSHHFQCTRTNVLGLERSFTRRHTLKMRFCGDKQGHAVLLLSTTAVHGSLTLESFLGHTRQMTLHTSLFLYLPHWRDLSTFFLNYFCTCHLLVSALNMLFNIVNSIWLISTHSCRCFCGMNYYTFMGNTRKMLVFSEKHCGYLIMTMITAINSRCVCVSVQQLGISLDIYSLLVYLVVDLRKCSFAFTCLPEQSEVLSVQGRGSDRFEASDKPPFGLYTPESSLSRCLDGGTD